MKHARQTKKTHTQAWKNECQNIFLSYTDYTQIKQQLHKLNQDEDTNTHTNLTKIHPTLTDIAKNNFITF